MKPKKCKLIINTWYGYNLAPMFFDSISQAMKVAHSGDEIGFAYRLFVQGETSPRTGFCK